jgi:polyphosphate kinase
MQSDGSFIQRQPDEGEDVRNSQLQLIQQWSQGVLQS